MNAGFSFSITSAFFLLMAFMAVSACPAEKSASAMVICITCSWYRMMP